MDIPFIDSYSLSLLQEYQWAVVSAEFTRDFNRQDPPWFFKIIKLFLGTSTSPPAWTWDSRTVYTDMH
jgi:hypothetical protein